MRWEQLGFFVQIIGFLKQNGRKSIAYLPELKKYKREMG